MELKDVLARLEQSTEYQVWRKTHANAFLAHAFVMLDEPNKGVWQIGLFDEQKNLMSTFVAGQDIKLIADQEVLKADQRILPLNPDDVKLPVAEALAQAQKSRLEHYPQEQPVKTFFIIQNTAAHGPVFNITMFTAGFKTINLKISTRTGAVVHRSMQALAAFG